VVVSKIAAIAAREVAGVHDLVTQGRGGAFTGLSQRVTGGDTRSQGVNVEVGEREAAIDLRLTMDYGVSIPQVAEGVRRNIISRLEAMTASTSKRSTSTSPISTPGRNHKRSRLSRASRRRGRGADAQRRVQVSEVTLARALVAAVRDVPSVADVSPGRFAEAATYGRERSTRRRGRSGKRSALDMGVHLCALYADSLVLPELAAPVRARSPPVGRGPAPTARARRRRFRRLARWGGMSG
jgi:uncharacterized alkaline shock family protein YloU